MKNSIEKTKKYNHLNYNERVKIEAYLNTNENISNIAILLNRNKATISREIRRNRNEREEIYKADFAENKKHRKRLKRGRKKQRLKDRKTRKLVATLIQKGHSPRTVADILEKKYNLKTNYESIYLWIYKERQDLIDFLAQKHRKRLKRGRKKQPRIIIQNKKDITERPEVVNTRERFGDFEFDLIVSSKSTHCILTILERKSRHCILRLLPNKKASITASELVKQLKRFPTDFCKTMTCDNGSENAYHDIVDKMLGTQTYFCKPYHSWEKGSVENLNKLVRRFLPKGTDFSLIKETDLYKIQNKLNMIPRKPNNFLSANQIINVALLH